MGWSSKYTTVYLALRNEPFFSQKQLSIPRRHKWRDTEGNIASPKKKLLVQMVQRFRNPAKLIWKIYTRINITVFMILLLMIQKWDVYIHVDCMFLQRISKNFINPPEKSHKKIPLFPGESGTDDPDYVRSLLRTGDVRIWGGWGWQDLDDNFCELTRYPHLEDHPI